MIKKIKQTYYVFVTEELLNQKPNFPVGVNLHLVILPEHLEEKYYNSEWSSILKPILIGSKGEIVTIKTTNKIFEIVDDSILE